MFRFRKSVKILPGVRMNFSRSGASVSLGGRGGSTTLGKRGISANVGIPGTGLSHRTKIGGASGGRSRLRAQERVEREQAKLEALQRRSEALSHVSITIEDNGALKIVDRDGEPLKGRDLLLAWEQQGDVIRGHLERHAGDVNGNIDLLNGIHLDTPAPSAEITIEPIEFDEPKPIEPARPRMPNEPYFTLQNPLGFFGRLFGGQRRYEEEQARRRAVHEAGLAKWSEECQRLQAEYDHASTRWTVAVGGWEKRRQDHAVSQEEAGRLHGERLGHDTDYMGEFLSEVISSLVWPRETVVSFDMDADGRTVWIDIDLPEIEDLPQRVTSIAASGKRLNIKDKAQKQLRVEYASHVHGVALRVAGTALASLPTSETVIVSGYSQRLDASTGAVNDDYLYSVRFTREGLSQIDFDALARVDPIAVFDNFDHRRKMTATGVFRAIEPFAPPSDTSQ